MPNRLGKQKRPGGRNRAGKTVCIDSVLAEGNGGASLVSVPNCSRPSNPDIYRLKIAEGVIPDLDIVG